MSAIMRPRYSHSLPSIQCELDSWPFTQPQAQSSQGSTFSLS